MIQKGLNSPPTSSLGRFFDGVAALAGLRREVAFEGQAAMELEFAIQDVRTEAAPQHVRALAAGQVVGVLNRKAEQRQQGQQGGGEEEMNQAVRELLHTRLLPEFLNRIDETIIFQNLTPEQIAEIVAIQIKKLGNRLAGRNIELSLSNAAISLIAEKGYDPVYGARPLKRLIQQVIENPLSMEILKGNIAEGARLSAEVEGDRIVFKTI